jgi:hypothetical protein
MSENGMNLAQRPPYDTIDFKVLAKGKAAAANAV